jgi:hypothetical protein
MVDEAIKYQPKKIVVPPLYAWPPQPLKALRYLCIDMQVEGKNEKNL